MRSAHYPTCASWRRKYCWVVNKRLDTTRTFQKGAMPANLDQLSFVLRAKVHARCTPEMIYSIMERAGFGVLSDDPIKFYPGEGSRQMCLIFFSGVRTNCSPENLIRNRAIVAHLREQSSNYADVPYTFNGQSYTYRVRLDRRLSGLDPFPLVTLGTDAS